MKKFLKKVLNAFKNKRVVGEIIRDASLASMVNFLYFQNKGIYEYALVILSLCGIIAGVILKEGVEDGE